MSSEPGAGHAVVVPTDVSSYSEARQAALAVERELGTIDVWINDAMTTVFAPGQCPGLSTRALELFYSFS